MLRSPNSNPVTSASAAVQWCVAFTTVYEAVQSSAGCPEQLRADVFSSLEPVFSSFRALVVARPKPRPNSDSEQRISGWPSPWPCGEYWCGRCDGRPKLVAIPHASARGNTKMGSCWPSLAFGRSPFGQHLAFPRHRCGGSLYPNL